MAAWLLRLQTEASNTLPPNRPEVSPAGRLGSGFRVRLLKRVSRFRRALYYWTRPGGPSTSQGPGAERALTSSTEPYCTRRSLHGTSPRAHVPSPGWRLRNVFPQGPVFSPPEAARSALLSDGARKRHQPTGSSVCLSVCLAVCLSVCESLCLSVCL